MRIDVLTLFPHLFIPFIDESILGRAVKRGMVDIRLKNIRDYARGRHKVTDDRPYGGGNGMVMKPGPICRALKSVDRVKGSSLAVLLTPQGQPFDQEMAWELSGADQLILVCGRYEGVDERVRTGYIDREISIGDYVLSGGELAALVIIDAVCRLLPGVLGGDRSTQEDSFEEGLLEYPHYTRPRIFDGKQVPDILLSGDHEKIRLWRRVQSLRRTLTKRPDLIEKADLHEQDTIILERIKKESRSEDSS
jgi:tRNA (guanine37-N1)-methyltransferase